MIGQSFPIWHFSWRNILEHDYNCLCCSCNTEDDLLVQMDLALSSWHIVVLLKCLAEQRFLIAVLFPSLSLPVHVQRTFSAFWARGFLTSKSDNLLEDVIHHRTWFLTTSRLLFSEQCQTDTVSKRSSWVWTVSVASGTSSRSPYRGQVMFLPKLDWTSWGCRDTTRHWANHSRKSHFLSLVDVAQREDLIHHLPACWHWTAVLVLSIF